MDELPTIDAYPARYQFRFCPICATPLARAVLFERERLRCPQCGWTFYPNANVASTIVVPYNGGIVLLRRAIEPDKGIWHLPIGHLEYGEDPADAALREGREETGLELAEPVFLDFEHGPSYQDARLYYLVFCYTARVVGGTLAYSDEASGAQVVPLDQLPPLKWTSQQRAIAAYRRLHGTNETE